ncbi:hypothetical protein ACTV1I_004478, partial [Cronobacter dublinensis]
MASNQALPVYRDDVKRRLLFLLPGPFVVFEPDFKHIAHLQHILAWIGFKTDYRDADTLLKFKQVHG